MEAKLPTSKKPALSSITSKCHLQYNISKYRLRWRRLLIISPTDTYTSSTQSSLFNSHITLVIQGFDYTLWTFFPRLSNALDTNFLIQSTIYFLQKDYPYPPYCCNPSFSLYFFIQTFSIIQSFFYVMTPTLKFKTLYNERNHCSFKQLHSGMCYRRFISYLFP